MDSKEYERYKDIGYIINLQIRNKDNDFDLILNYCKNHDYTYNKINKLCYFIKERVEVNTEQVSRQLKVSIETARQIMRAIIEGGAPIKVRKIKSENYFSHKDLE